MRKHKWMMAQFTFYDRTGICKLLEQQAEKGWLLESISSLGWKFKRTEPRKVHYAVTYFPKASAYDPGPSEQQRELQEFCAHSGWILAGTSAQMQVFYNLAEDPVPIETDPMMELENIHRSAKKNYLPAYIILFVLAIFQIALQIGQAISYPLTYLSQNSTLFNFFCQSVLFLMCGQEILGYFLWYRKARAAAENGEFVETKGHRNFQLFLMWLVIGALILLLISMAPVDSLVMVACLVLMTCVYAVVGLSQFFMKKWGVARNVNRTVTIVMAFVMAFAVTSFAVYKLSDVMHLQEENRVVGYYDLHGMQVELYDDPIPLCVEDMLDVSNDDYSRSAREEKSLLLKRSEYYQRIWGPAEEPDLEYVIYETSIPAIYDLCVRECLKPRDYPIDIDTEGNEIYDTYLAQDAAPWGAREVYRRYVGEDAGDYWTLCFENRVVVFQPGWELTPEQMTIVGEKLGK